MSPHVIDLIAHHQFGLMGIGVGGVVCAALLMLGVGIRVTRKHDKPLAIILPLFQLAFASWVLIQIVEVTRH